MKRQPQTDSLTISRLRRWSLYFTGVIVTFSAVLIAVALLDLPIMNPVTATTFMASGVSLLILIPGRNTRRTAGGLFLASLILAIALLRMVSVCWPGFWRVDYLFYSHRLINDARAHLATPRTMSPSTAVTFILSGTALLLLPVRRRSAIVTSQLLAICIGLIGLFTMVCFLYGVEELHRPGITIPMAESSTVCFMLLALVILCAAPGKGIMRQITGPYTGSLMARRSIPFALIVPILFGWAALFSPWRNSVSVPFSAAILLFGIILASLAFIGHITTLLNRRDLADLQIRQALLATQEKIAYQARLMEDSSDAIFTVDAGYRIVTFNKAAEALYGYTAAEVIGQPLNDVLRNPMADEQRAEIRRELLEIGYWRGLVNYHTRNKPPLDIAMSVSRTQDEKGRVAGYIMVCRDMTDNFELRDLTSRLQRVREEERGTIAREIHDELGQQLTGLKMDLFWIAKRLDSPASDQARQKLRSTMSLLDETIQTVRRIATDLRPSILDDLGLVAAIEWQSQEFEKRAGIRTVFQSSIPEIDFPPDIAIGMFRICQESLTNVARHAAASRVSITLEPARDGVCMAISDDGSGLDPARLDRKTLGLVGMKERALMMGGRLEMGNGETKGFRLAVTVPLPAILSA